VEAVNIVNYVLQELDHTHLEKNPYMLFKGKSPKSLTLESLIANASLTTIAKESL